MRRGKVVNTTLRRSMIIAAFAMSSTALFAMLLGLPGTGKVQYTHRDIQKIASTLSLVSYSILLILFLTMEPFFSWSMRKSVESLVSSITGRRKKQIDTTEHALKFWDRLFTRVELIDSVLIGFLTVFSFLPYVAPVIMIIFEKRLSREQLFLLKGIVYSAAATTVIAAYYTVVHGVRSPLLVIALKQKRLIAELIRRQEIPLANKVDFSEVDIEDTTEDISRVLVCPHYSTKNISSVVPYRSFLSFVTFNLVISALFYYIRHYTLV